MLLTHALQQIQKPTWWVFESKAEKVSAALKENARIKKAERKRLVADFFRQNSERWYSSHQLVELCGIPRSSIQEVLDELLREGALMRDTTKIRCAVAHIWKARK